VASIDAQINLILKGVSELKKLSSALDEIENTANSIQDLFGRGVFGRVSDINTYIKALGQIEKTAAATRLQAAAIADVNSETKRALIVESQLRRERSRTARLSRAFEIETKGLDQTKGKLKEIKEQFDEVSVALKSAFKLGDVKIISQLRNELSALVEDQREWNRTLAGTKNTGVNADFLKEQARGYAQQIEQLRKRALALSKNEEIIRRLAAAEFNLVKQRDKNTGAFTQFADPRLGRELLSNIKAQITAEEQLARERERFSGQYERQQKEARRQAISTAQTIAAIARKAGGATFDALTFGQGAKVARGARNAAIRGGLGLGALGLGGAYAATQEALGNINLGPIQGPAVEAANAIGGAINNALGGVPAIINDMLSALGNVPGSLGLASVAALAFAPAMKTAADAVFLAGKKFGATKFGEDIKLTLDRQTNLFESVINKASEMNMVLDASRSGLDAVGKKIETLPALPAAGQTAFAGPMRRGRGGAFIGGGARELLSPEFLATATGAMAQRTQEAADTSLLFAEGLGQAATEAKTIAEYLKQANELRAKGESSTQRFIRQTIERGRIVTQGRQSAEIARERSAFLTGSSYSLSQVPARGELFPGGRTETAQSAYRELLNTTARINQLQQDLLQNMSKQQGFSATIGQLERRTINDKGRSLVIQQQENEELQRSVQIIRERNKELRQRPIAAMTPQERVSQGILDPKSLRADRERRIEIGRLDPLERFYAGFQPRRLAARSARATSEGLVGGAFPLLFGQGIGAAALGGLGGAAGGFAGGGLGFGLSLVGTALGTAFDEAVQGAKELGDALQKPVENFDQLAEKSFFSSKALEDTIKKTIEYGDTATASALIQEEAIKKLGVGGVENLKTLGTESDRLSRAFAELGQQMQAVAAGPLASIAGFFANIFGQAAAAGRVRLLRANLSQEQAGQFNQEVRQRLQQQGIQRGIFAPSAPTDAEIGMLQNRGALQDIVDKWQAIEIQGKIKFDPKQRFESEINALQKKLEVLDIGKSLIDQYRSVQREQKDLDKQRADLVRSYEESIGDIRKRVEDEVANRRFSILEKENQLLDQQGQNRLKQLQLANQELIAGAGRGERPEIEQAARNAAEIVAAFTEDQLSAEEEAAKIKRNAALDSLKFDYQAAEFKASIEKEVSRLNIETARRVADINEQVRRRNEEFDNRRFAIEKQIADLQLKIKEDEAKASVRNVLKQFGGASPEFGFEVQTLTMIQEARKSLQNVSAPALRGVGQVGGGGVSTQSIDAVVAKEKAAIAAIVQAALQGADLLKQEGIDRFKNSINDLITGIEAPINAINQSILDADQERVRYSELISRGLTDTVAQRVIEIEKARDLAVAQLDNVINELEKRKAVEGTTEAIKTQIDTEIQGIRDRQKALNEATGVAPGDGKPGTGLIGRAVESEEGRKIQDFINSAQEGLNDLESYAIRVSQGIGDAVGNSLSNGVAGLIEGTATAKEVFAGFLKDVGQTLAQEGAKMIATYVAIGIAKIFAGLAAGASSSSSSTAIPSTGTPAAPTINGFDTGSIANIAAKGAYFSGGQANFAQNSIQPFAAGGIVSSPTLFQFADGGVSRNGLMGEAGPEAIMPLERGPDGKLGVSAKLSGAMSRYSRPPGAGGGSEGGSGDSASTGGGAAVATAPIDVRYTVERINSVDYVTADQFQVGMRQAAEQGARRGEQRALTNLRQNTNTRRRIGL
jgi:hypothetical protein